MSDPVAAKSTFLCMYMSSHPDTLVSYVRYWGKITEKVTSAQMKSIDTKGMSLTYQTKAGGDSKKEIVVVFDPPLAGYEEVKPRLLNMKVEAEEALGMVKAPHLPDFRFPRRAIYTAIPMLFQCYVTISPHYDDPSYSPIYALGNFLREAVRIPIIYFWYLILFTHGLESIYTISLCRKHRASFFVGFQYWFMTFIFGFPIFTDLRKRMQAARIDSIMKGN